MPTMNPIASSELKHRVDEKYDVVIVGSGAGGAVLAKELAEGGMKVAIVEEGAYHRQHKDLAFDAILRMYRDRGLSSTLGSPIIPVPMGKTFGGTTTINSGTCFRVPGPVLSSWHEKRGLSDLATDELERAYGRVEREINVEPSDFAVMGRSNTLVHELFAKAGFKGAPLLRNIRGCKGCGFCPYGCSEGAKQSMDVSYLPKALKAGVVAYTEAKVTRILLDSKGAACGVEAEAVLPERRRRGVKIRLRADRVIIAAGAFYTPPLLKENGLARGNRHLGRHLTLHPATKVLAEFDEVIDGWEGTPQAYYLDAFHDDGIMFEGIFTPPDMAGMTVPFIGKKLIDFMKRYRHMASFGFLISDESEGSLVKLPFFGYSYRYSLQPNDVRRMQRAIGFLARVFLEGGAKKVYPLIRGQEPFAHMDEVVAFEKRHLSAGEIDCMAFHPLGTARIGKGPEDGVTDTNHQVFGVPNLYVCDGSSVPTSLGVNPQLTIMAFATRLASRLLEKPLA